jgi:hypothetical protein
MGLEELDRGYGIDNYTQTVVEAAAAPELDCRLVALARLIHSQMPEIAKTMIIKHMRTLRES